MHCHGQLSRFVSMSATFFYVRDVFLRDFLRCRAAAHLTFCEEEVGAMDLWAVPAHGGTTDSVSEAQVRRNHAIIRRYSVSPMSLR
jgi:hypothetical protein